MTRINLTQNVSISRIIKGNWQLSAGHLIDGSVDRDNAIKSCADFVSAGVTTFDVADIYTGAEELLGEFLSKNKKEIELGNMERPRIHTKYVPDMDMLSTLKLEDTEAIIDRSLMRLGVDCLDLVQFHWWDVSIPRYVEVANNLKILKDKGKIQHIGVTNFSTEQLSKIVSSGVPVVSAQVQYSILDGRPKGAFTEFCQDNNIQMLCYGTLAGGFLSEKYLGVEEKDVALDLLPNRSLVKYRLMIDEFGGWDCFQAVLKCCKAIADRYDVTVSDVAIAYTLKQKSVAAAIVGARDSKHLDKIKNFNNRFENISLDPLEEFLKKNPSVTGDVYFLERETDKHKNIMKTNLNYKTA